MIRALRGVPTSAYLAIVAVLVLLLIGRLLHIVG